MDELKFRMRFVISGRIMTRFALFHLLLAVVEIEILQDEGSLHMIFVHDWAPYGHFLLQWCSTWIQNAFVFSLV